MNTEEMKKELEVMQKGLESKSSELIKAEVKSFEAKLEDLKKEIGVATGEEKKALETVKEELAKQIAEVKKHADELDVKFSAPAIHTSKKSEDPIREMITKNFSEIAKVEKGYAVNLESKAVGDMLLSTHLTGDQPRSYSQSVAMVPSQILNVADLVPTINIDGGTYTFPRETGGEGSIGAQTEGNVKNQKDYDPAMIDVNTDFIAGFTVYSKKMRNNLPFLESFLPRALRRDYMKAENAAFAASLASGVTASTQLAAGSDTFIEQLMKEVATLEGGDFGPNGIVVSPAAWYTIFTQEKSAGSGYARPGIVTLEGGVLRINGIPVFKANWLATTNKYFVGDWNQVQKVVTEGLSLSFSESDSDNFRRNKITARIEAQVGLAVERPDALIYGDFTAA